MYVIQSVVLCNTQFGQVSTRVRRYNLLVLKAANTEICRPLTDVSAALGRERSDTFTMLNHCVASPEELNLELAWAASRPASRAHAAGFSPSVPLTIASSMAFETALTNCEHKHLLKSQASAPGERVVVPSSQMSMRARIFRHPTSCTL